MSPLDRSTRHPEAALPVIERGIVSLALLAGLALVVVPPAHGQRVSKLSDAAKEASKPAAEQRPLQGSDKERSPAVVVASPVVIEGCIQRLEWPAPRPGHYPGSFDEPYGGDPGPPSFNHLHVGVVTARGSLSSPDFAASNLMGLRLGTGNAQRAMVDLVLLGGSARFTPGSDIGRAFRNPREVGLEGSLRYELLSSRAPIGIAPVVGFRVGRLSWRYANPILIEDSAGLREVGGDQVWHYSPILGLSLTALRFRHLEVGVTALTAWRFYGAESGQGLTNDLFGDDSYNELRLETRIF